MTSVSIGDDKGEGANGTTTTSSDPSNSSGSAVNPVSVSHFDPFAPGNLNGVQIFDHELDNFEDKPWRKPGADLTDYFNFGFNETTWRAYCVKQKALREEFGLQKKIGVYDSSNSTGGGSNININIGASVTNANNSGYRPMQREFVRRPPQGQGQGYQNHQSGSASHNHQGYQGHQHNGYQAQQGYQARPTEQMMPPPPPPLRDTREYPPTYSRDARDTPSYSRDTRDARNIRDSRDTRDFSNNQPYNSAQFVHGQRSQYVSSSPPVPPAAPPPRHISSRDRSKSRSRSRSPGATQRRYVSTRPNRYNDEAPRSPPR